MSNARPLTTPRRHQRYLIETYLRTGRMTLTPRQARQVDRMARREELRGTGELEHGASGVPVRRPVPWIPAKEAVGERAD